MEENNIFYIKSKYDYKIIYIFKYSMANFSQNLPKKV